jgi:ABC transporter substrate binding protein
VAGLRFEHAALAISHPIVLDLVYPRLESCAASFEQCYERIVAYGVASDDVLRGAKQKGAVLSSAFLFAHRAHIVGLAAEVGLATIFQWPETAEEGGLLAYGPALNGAFRLVATLVAKVLRGANPGELPVEQPMKFAFFINLKSAKALGLTVPLTMLTRADVVIE